LDFVKYLCVHSMSEEISGTHHRTDSRAADRGEVFAWEPGANKQSNGEDSDGISTRDDLAGVTVCH